MSMPGGSACRESSFMMVSSEYIGHDVGRLRSKTGRALKADAYTNIPKGRCCMSFLSRKHLQYLRRIASHYAVGRHVFRDDTTGPDDRVFSHSYSAKQRRTGTN